MQVCIRTEMGFPSNQTKIKLIEWNDSSDRKWFQSHMHWAMCNNIQVKVRPASNYDRTIHEIASRGDFGDKLISE